MVTERVRTAPGGGDGLDRGEPDRLASLVRGVITFGWPRGCGWMEGLIEFMAAGVVEVVVVVGGSSSSWMESTCRRCLALPARVNSGECVCVLSISGALCLFFSCL